MTQILQNSGPVRNEPQRHATEPVHVLHVVPGLMPGGMELGMAKVIRGLTCSRMRHSVVCLKGEPEIADRLPPETSIHCMHARPNEMRLLLRLRRLIHDLNPDVVHARNWGAWPDTVAARFFAKPTLPLILSFHGLGKAGYMPLRRRLASHALARMSTRLVAVSNESKNLMASKWGWPRTRVQVIPNGVDTSCFAAAETPPARKRMIVGTVGNLRPVKNHALLLRACTQIAGEGFDLELRIAGEGSEREPLLNLARSAGFGDRLKLYGQVEDVPAFLRQLDVFVLSSDSEQHPNALNEAMACSLACVATRVGCVAELLDGDRCGKIVQPGDDLEMTDAIRELLLDSTGRRLYGQLARQRACEHYSLKAMLDAYRSLYFECAGVNGK